MVFIFTLWQNDSKRHLSQVVWMMKWKQGDVWDISIHLRFHVYHPLIANKALQLSGKCVRRLLLLFKNSYYSVKINGSCGNLMFLHLKWVHLKIYTSNNISSDRTRFLKDCFLNLNVTQQLLTILWGSSS